MNVDVAAHEAAREIRDQVVDVPPLETLRVRARRHRARRIGASSLAVLVVVSLVLFGLSRSGRDASPAVSAAGAGPRSSWARLSKATAGFGPNATFTAMAAGSTGFVVVGSVEAPTGSTGASRAAVWFSSDGSSWAAVGRAAFASAGSVNAVAFRRGSFWVTGSKANRATTWTSADGRTWVARSSNLPAVAPMALVADPAGLIAYNVGGPLGRRGPEAWVSGNGRTWQPSNLPGYVQAVTRDRSTLVALVDEFSGFGVGRAAIFSSRDGLHWVRRADLGPTVDPGSATLTTWDGALWAVTYPGSGTTNSALWRSRDGIAWLRAPAAAPREPCSTC